MCLFKLTMKSVQWLVGVVSARAKIYQLQIERAQFHKDILVFDVAM